MGVFLSGTEMAKFTHGENPVGGLIMQPHQQRGFDAIQKATKIGLAHRFSVGGRKSSSLSALAITRN
jgi:hypothetical protein